MSESPQEKLLKSSNPIRGKALKQYWAGVQKWAEQRGQTKEETHAHLKVMLNFNHLSELDTPQLQDMAYEIGVIADGGPGE